MSFEINQPMADLKQRLGSQDTYCDYLKNSRIKSLVENYNLKLENTRQ